jgi:hypothetical protein
MEFSDFFLIFFFCARLVHEIVRFVFEVDTSKTVLTPDTIFTVQTVTTVCAIHYILTVEAFFTIETFVEVL